MEEKKVLLSLAPKKKPTPAFVGTTGLREHVVDWSDDKVRRMIEHEGFPAQKEPTGRYIFDVQKCIDWLKRMPKAV